MEYLAPIIGSFATLLTVFGGAFAWIWRQIKARLKEQDIKLANCEAREKHSQRQGAIQLTVIELLYQETSRLSPEGANPVLNRAQKLLKQLKTTFQVDPSMPPELLNLLCLLNHDPAE